MENFRLKSKDDLIKYLGTDEQCFEYLIQTRWGDKPNCPKCHNKEKVYYIKSRKAFKCSTCNSQISIRKGTIFENSNIPIRLWFRAIFNVSVKKIGNAYKATQAVNDLGVSYKAAFYMLHKIRELMREENENTTLKGVIEGDEVYLGPQLAKDNKLRYKVYNAENKRIIAGLETEEEFKSRKSREEKWEQKTGKKLNSLASRIPDLINTTGTFQNTNFYNLDYLEALYPKHHYKRNTVILLQRDVCEYFEKNGREYKRILEYGKIVVLTIGRQKSDVDMSKITPYLKKHIQKNSILITDETGIYNGARSFVKEHFQVLHSKRKNTQHKPIKYSKEQENDYGIKFISTNGVENVNKHIKTMQRNYIHVSYAHCDRYNFEYVFEYNSRGLDIQERFTKLFGFALTKAVSISDIFNTRLYYSYRPKRKLRELKKFSE